VDEDRERDTDQISTSNLFDQVIESLSVEVEKLNEKNKHDLQTKFN